MINGAQIRKARELLGWQPKVLANRAKLARTTIQRAESSDGESLITIAQQVLIRRVLETAGIVFVEGDQPDVRLRAARLTPPQPSQPSQRCSANAA